MKRHYKNYINKKMNFKNKKISFCERFKLRSLQIQIQIQINKYKI